MDEIEYLEEFEDMVQTSIAPNTMRSSANNKESERELVASLSRQEPPPENSDDDDDDEDESSCSFEIFEKLFNSSNEDLRIDKKCSPSKKKSNAASSSSTKKPNVRHGPDSFTSSDYDSDDPIYKVIYSSDNHPKPPMSSRTGAERDSLDSIDALVNDLGEYLPESSQKSQTRTSRTVQNSSAVTTTKQRSRQNSLNSIRGRPPINSKTATAPVNKRTTNMLSKSKEILPTKNPLVSMKPQMAERKVLNNSEPKPSQRPTNSNTTKTSKVVATASASSTSTPRLSKPKYSRQHTMNKTRSPPLSTAASSSSRLKVDKPSTSKAPRTFVDLKELKGGKALQPYDDPLHIENFDDDVDEDVYHDEDNEDDDNSDVDDDDFMSLSGNESFHSSDYDLFDSNIDSGENIIDISTDSNNSKFSELRSTPPPNISDSENEKNDDVDDRIDYFKELREKYFDNIKEYFDPNQNESKKLNINSSTATMDNSVDKPTADDDDDKDLKVSLDNNSAEIIDKDSSFEQNLNEKNTNTKVIDSDKLTKEKSPVNDKEPGEQVEESKQQNSSLDEIKENELSKSDVIENEDEVKDNDDFELMTTDLNDLELSTTSSEIKDLDTMPLFNMTDSETKSELEDDLDSVSKMKDLTISPSTTTKIEDIELMTKINDLNLDSDSQSTIKDIESMLPNKDLESSESLSKVKESSVLSPSKILKESSDQDSKSMIKDLETKVKDKDSNDLETKSNKEEELESSTDLETVGVSEPKAGSTPYIQLPISSVEIMEPTSTTTLNNASKEQEQVHRIKRRLYTHESDYDGGDTKDTESEVNFNESSVLEQIEQSSLELQKQIIEMDNNLEISLEYHQRCGTQSVNSRRSSASNKQTQKNTPLKNTPQKILNKHYSKERSMPSASTSAAADSTKKERDKSNPRKPIRRGGSNPISTSKKPPAINIETSKDNHTNNPKEVPKDLDKKSEKEKLQVDKSNAAAATDAKKETVEEVKGNVKESQKVKVDNPKPEKNSEENKILSTSIKKKKHRSKSEKSSKSEKEDLSTKSKSIEAINVSISNSEKQKSPLKSKEIKEESEKQKAGGGGGGVSKNNKSNSGSVSSISDNEKTPVKNKKQMDNEKISKKSKDHKFEKPQQRKSISESTRKIRSRENSSDSNRNRDSSLDNRSSSIDERKMQNVVKSSPSRQDYKSSESDSSSMSSSNEKKSLEKTNKDAANVSSEKSKSSHVLKEFTVKKVGEDHSRKPKETMHKDVGGSTITPTKEKDKEYHNPVKDNLPSTSKDIRLSKEENKDKTAQKSSAKEIDKKTRGNVVVKEDIRKSFSKEKKDNNTPQKQPISKDLGKRGGGNVKEDMSKEKMGINRQKSTAKDLDKRGGGNAKEKEVVKPPQKSSSSKDNDKKGEVNLKEDFRKTFSKEKKDMKTTQNPLSEQPKHGNREGKDEKPTSSSSFSSSSGDLKDAKKNIVKKKSLGVKSKSNVEIVKQKISEQIKQPLLDKKTISKSLSSSSFSLGASNTPPIKASLEQSDSTSIKKLNITEKEKVIDKEKSSSSSSVSQTDIANKSSTTAEVVAVLKESTDKASLHDEAAATNELSVPPRRSTRRNEEIVVPINIPTPNVIRETRSTNNPSPRTTRSQDTNPMMRTKLTRSVVKNVLENQSNHPERVGDKVVSSDDYTDSSVGDGSGAAEQLRKRKQISASEFEPKTKMNRSTKKEKIDNKEDTERTLEDHKESVLDKVAAEKAINEPATNLNENVDDEIKTIDSKGLDKVTTTSTITKTPTENEPQKSANLKEIGDDKTKIESENKTQNVLDEDTNDVNFNAEEKESEHPTTSSSSLLHLEESKKKQDDNDKQVDIEIKTYNLDELIKPATTTIVSKTMQQVEAEVMPPGTSDETTYDNLPASSDLLPLCDNGQVLPCDDIIVDQVIKVAFSQIDTNCVVVGSGGGDGGTIGADSIGAGSGNPINDVVNSLVIGGQQNDELSKEMEILFNTEINCDNEKLLHDSACESSSIRIKETKTLITGNSKNPDLKDSDPTKAIIEIAKILQEESESMEALEFRRNEAQNVVAPPIAAVDETFEETGSFLLKSLENIVNKDIESSAVDGDDTSLNKIDAKEAEIVQSSTDSTIEVQAASGGDNLKNKDTIIDFLVNQPSSKTKAATENSVVPIPKKAFTRTEKDEEPSTSNINENEKTKQTEKKLSQANLKGNQKDLKLQEVGDDTILNPAAKGDNINVEKENKLCERKISNIVDKEIIVADPNNQKIELDQTNIVVSTTKIKNKIKTGSSKTEIISNNIELNTKSESDKEIPSSNTNKESNSGNIVKVGKMDTNKKVVPTDGTKNKSKGNPPESELTSNPPSDKTITTTASKTTLRVRVKRVIIDDKVNLNSTERRQRNDAKEAHVKVASEKGTTIEKQTQEIANSKSSKAVGVVQPTKVQDGYASTDTDTSFIMKVTRTLRNRGVETPVQNTNDPSKRRFNRVSDSSKQAPTSNKQTRFGGNKSGNVDDTQPPNKKLKLTGNSEAGNKSTKNNKPEKPSHSQATGSSAEKAGTSSMISAVKESNKTKTATSTVTRRSTPQLYKDMNERMATRHKPITIPSAALSSSLTNTKINVDVGVKTSKKEDTKVTAKIDKLIKSSSTDEIKEPAVKKQRESFQKTPTTTEKKADADILEMSKIELDKCLKKDENKESKFDKILTTTTTKTNHDTLPKVKPTTSSEASLAITPKETTTKVVGQATRRKVFKTPDGGVGNGGQTNSPPKLESSLNASNSSIPLKPLVLTTLQRKTPKDITKSSSLASTSSSRDTSKERAATRKPVSLSKSMEINTKTPVSVSKSMEIDTKTTVSVSKSMEIDTKTPVSVSKSMEIDTKTPVSISKSMEIYTKTPVSVSKSMEIDTKPPTKPTVETIDTKEIGKSNKTEKVKIDDLSSKPSTSKNVVSSSKHSASKILFSTQTCTSKDVVLSQPTASKDVKNPSNITRNSKGIKVQEEQSSPIKQTPLKLPAAEDEKVSSKHSVETDKVVAVAAPTNITDKTKSAENCNVSIKELEMGSKASDSLKKSSKTNHSSQPAVKKEKSEDGGKPVKAIALDVKATQSLETTENSIKDHGESSKAVSPTKISNKSNNPPQTQPLKDQKVDEKPYFASTEITKPAETLEILNKECATANKMEASSSRTSNKSKNPQQQTSDNKEPGAVAYESSKAIQTTTTEETKDNVAFTSNDVEPIVVSSKNTRKSLRERVPPVKLRNAGKVNNSNSTTMEMSATPPLAESLHSLVETRSTSSQSLSSEISMLSTRFRKRKNVVTPVAPITTKRVRLDLKQLATKSNTSSVASSEISTAEKSTRQLPKQRNLPSGSVAHASTQQQPSGSKPSVPIALTLASNTPFPLSKEWDPVVRLSRSLVNAFTQKKKDDVIEHHDVSTEIVNNDKDLTHIELKHELDDMSMDVGIETTSNTHVTTTSVGPTTSSIITSTVTGTTATSRGDGTTSTSVVNNPRAEIGNTRLYSYIHPAKYRSSYGQVQLDYCCPDLAGPMTAIDPTRLHQKIEVPVLEVPRYIVMTTKVIKASDYKKNPSILPEQVRIKLERRNGEMTFISDVSAQEPQKLKRTAAGKMTLEQQKQAEMKAKQSSMRKAVPTSSGVALTVKAATTPQPVGKKQLQTPSNTTPTATAATSTTKQNIRTTIQRVQQSSTIANAAAIASSTSATASSTSASAAALQSLASSIIDLNIPQTSHASVQDRSELRRNAEIFSELLLKLSKLMLPMSEQHRRNIIDNIVSNSLLQPIDFEHGIKMLQNYEMWMKMAASSTPLPRPTLRATTSQIATVSVPASAAMIETESKSLNAVTGLFEMDVMPALKTPLSKTLARQRPSAAAVNQVSPQVATSTNSQAGVVAIYDVDRHIVGYQMPLAETVSSSSSNQINTAKMSTISKVTVKTTTTPTNNRGGKQATQAANKTTKRKQTSTAVQAQSNATIAFCSSNTSSASETNTASKATGNIRVRSQQLMAYNSSSCSTSLLAASTSPAVGKATTTQSNKKAVPKVEEKPSQFNKQTTVTTISPTDISTRKTPAPRSNRRSVKHLVTQMPPTTSTASSSSGSSYQQPSTSTKELDTSKTITTTTTRTSKLLTITALKAATNIDIIAPELMEESILPDAENTSEPIQIKSEDADEEVII